MTDNTSQPMWETMLAMIEMDEYALSQARSRLEELLDQPTVSAGEIDEQLDGVMTAFLNMQAIQANIEGMKLVLKAGDRG